MLGLNSAKITRDKRDKQKSTQTEGVRENNQIEGNPGRDSRSTGTKSLREGSSKMFGNGPVSNLWPVRCLHHVIWSCLEHVTNVYILIMADRSLNYISSHNHHHHHSMAMAPSFRSSLPLPLLDAMSPRHMTGTVSAFLYSDHR